MLHDEVLEITVQKEKCKNYIPLFVMMWEVFSNETDGESFLMCNNVMGSWKYLKSEKMKWSFGTIKVTSLQLTTKNALSWSSFLCNINCIQNRQKLHYRILRYLNFWSIIIIAQSITFSIYRTKIVNYLSLPYNDYHWLLTSHSLSK